MKEIIIVNNKIGSIHYFTEQEFRQSFSTEIRKVSECSNIVEYDTDNILKGWNGIFTQNRGLGMGDRPDYEVVL